MENTKLHIEKEQEPRFAYRRVFLWIFGLLLAATALALRTAQMDIYVRSLIVATLVVGIVTGLIHLIKLFESYPKLLYPTIFILGLGILWSILANKPPNEAALREYYLKQLNSFKGARYAENGETHIGIDCSGLARATLWQSMLKEGIKEFNPYLLGPRLWQFWWRDMSASDMAACKYGYTKYVDTVDKLAGYDHSWLNRGDLAVAGGSYVLIYMGDAQWIEANPDDGKVVLNKATAGSKRPYFNMKVKIMRWWIL
ncbi:MAG: hypothetical protein NT018_03155 [Armatimonadetes bacterium]|nr:hypothetical protein [Armatimonadota bacterium]